MTFTSKKSNSSVQFDVYEPDSSGTMKLPENVGFWKSKLSTDEDGMIALVNKDGQYYYNISSVAFQAMNSRDLKVLTKSSQKLSLKQTKALEWLNKHKVVLNNGSYIWYYNFPLNYNNIVVISSWPSAFSQAAVIYAYIAFIIYQFTYNSSH
ncbi:hypothetical protein LC653_09920 [Nostoc sp. CHAB 5784]|uniref:hypothetical protein n=1 Tax=Nostoc mirabile TaxID=2907820 RepID=UPI001E459AA5|nr:hypothetical protein [Nostoc mirabile]MCC5664226.1 hypothetical protein [Nostoc mirabile CHAB5784]